MQENYRVYIQTDTQGRIVAVNSSAFLVTPPPEGWTPIDEGTGDRYHHAQGNYFAGPLMDERGICRYKFMDGATVERTQAEMDADYAPSAPVPTIDERVGAVEAEQSAQAGTLEELVLYLAGEIGGASQ